MARLVDRQVPDVDAVDAHRAPGDVLESRHEGGERRLARPGGAHQRERLSRRDAQVESAQGEPVGVGEVEVDVVEVELPAEAPDVRVVGDPAVGIGDVVADVDDLPVAPGGRDRHEGVGEEEPEHLDGHPRTIEIVTPATTVPIVVHPCTTPHVPTPTIAAWASVGRRMRRAQNHESSFALRTSRLWNRRESTEKRSAAHGERPKDLRIRMPWIDSSTSVVISPTVSCDRREASRYLRSKIAAHTIVGTAMAIMMSPKIGWSAVSMIVPTTRTIGVASRNGRPKAKKRRAWERSVVARESAVPTPTSRGRPPRCTGGGRRAGPSR